MIMKSVGSNEDYEVCVGVVALSRCLCCLLFTQTTGLFNDLPVLFYFC